MMILNLVSVTIIDKVKNRVIRELYGVPDDAVTEIEKGMLRLFGLLERMHKENFTKPIYVGIECEWTRWCR